MKKLFSLLMLLSLGLFALGCQAEPGDVGTGDEAETEELDTDVGEGEDMLDDEPGEGDPGNGEEVDLDPGAGEDIGDTEPAEGEIDAGDGVDLDPGAGEIPGETEPGEVDAVEEVDPLETEPAETP